jgi:hypothetical protein
LATGRRGSTRAICDDQTLDDIRNERYDSHEIGTGVKASRVPPLSPRNIIVRVFSRRPPWHRWADLAIASYVADSRTTSDGASRTEVVFVTDTWRLHGDQWRMIERSTSTAGAAVVK